MKYKSILKYILKELRFRNYQKVFNKSYPWVLVSYLTLPFYLRHYKSYMLEHQNREGTLIIFDVFRDLGLNFLGINYKEQKITKFLPEEQVKIIFGLEPNFINFSKIYPYSLKLYFATGAYYKHQNSMIIKRTDEVNKRKGSSLAYNRLVQEHNSAHIADSILQIGSKYTLETYPVEIRKKIRIIRQNTFEFLNYDEVHKKQRFDKKTFLWFGSSGSILKGLDLVLDYFSKNKKYILHVVGPVDKDFQKVYENELFYTSNIYFHGPLKINSKKLFKIALESSFIIFPSASEGGCPGSVLNMMRLGMIPLVSKFAAFDSIEDKGIIINDLSEDGIQEAVKKTQILNNEELLDLFKKNSSFVESHFNSETFYKDLKEHISKMLESE
jgi:hypothetical protein